MCSKLVNSGNVPGMAYRRPLVPSGVEIEGRRLREVRKQRGETLHAFADRCGISFGYLGQVERGTRPTVSPPMFVRICDALGISEVDRPTLLIPAARERLKQVA